MIELLYKQNRQTTSITLSKIDFETARLFLEKKVKIDKELSKLTFINNQLLYDGDMLIDEVKSFDKKLLPNMINFSLCIEKNILVCQDMIFRIN